MQINLDVAVFATQGGKGRILIDHVAQNFHINGSAFQEVPAVCDFRGRSVLCNHGLSEVSLVRDARPLWTNEVPDEALRRLPSGQTAGSCPAEPNGRLRYTCAIRSGRRLPSPR